MKKIAIFASGNGSNFEAIVEAVKRKYLYCDIELLVCDKKGAYAITRANNHNIDTFVFNPKDYKNKEEYEKEILEELVSKKIDLIVLAGYMRLIGNTLLSMFEDRIINIHPSLLPAFKGKDAIGQAIDYGVKVMGVTVHYVDSGMDTGRIIEQDSFRLMGNETTSDIEEQIHAIEHRLYPKVIKDLLRDIISENCLCDNPNCPRYQHCEACNKHHEEIGNLPKCMREENK